MGDQKHPEIPQDKQTLRVLSSLPRSGTHWLKLMIMHILGVETNESRLVDVKMLQKALEAGDSRIILHDHFQFSKHGSLLDPDTNPNLKLIILYRHPIDALISYYYRLKLSCELDSSISTPNSFFKKFCKTHIFNTPIPASMRTVDKELISLPHNDMRDFIYEYAIGWIRNRSCLQVRFEDLLEDTEKQIKRIADYLNVALSEAEIKDAISSYSFEKLSGGRKPGEIDESDHYRCGMIGEWKSVLDASEVRYLKNRIGGYIAELGYSFDEKEVQIHHKSIDSIDGSTPVSRKTLVDWNIEEILSHSDTCCHAIPNQQKVVEIFHDHGEGLLYKPCSIGDHVFTLFITPTCQISKTKCKIVVRCIYPKENIWKRGVIQLQNSRYNTLYQCGPKSNQSGTLEFEVVLSSYAKQIRLVFTSDDGDIISLPSLIHIDEIEMK